MELLIARNPDRASSLPFVMLVPIAGGLVFRVKGTWPRTSAIYCHPVPHEEWPAEPDLVERVQLRVCERRGAAIDLVAGRAREHRSQLVFTTARGRQVVFWQAPRTRKQARPAVRVPTARAASLADARALCILIDVHERYPYRFAGQAAVTERRPLACGDYAVEFAGQVVASVERKSLPDLLSSLTSGRLRYALGELSGVPRAAVVVEDRYSQVFAQDRVRPALVADGLAESQVRWPAVPLVLCETRKLAEEWTYRWLAAARSVRRGRRHRQQPLGADPARGTPGDASRARAGTVHRCYPRLGPGDRPPGDGPRPAAHIGHRSLAGQPPGHRRRAVRRRPRSA